MITTVVVTRNRSCSVKTLHLIMSINISCMKNKKYNEIIFINDDPFMIGDLLTKKIHEKDRIIFIDYGVGIAEHDDIERLVKDFEKGYECMVMPCVKEGLDWEKIKTNLVTKSKEPVEQAGMDFDTDVGDHIRDGLYKVTKTSPKLFAIDCKTTVELLKNRKKPTIFLPPKRDEMFEKFIEKKLNIYAYTKARVVIAYQHESIGKISQAYGLTKSS